MRFTASEKEEIIHLVVRSEIGVNKTLHEIGVNKSTFYNWYNVYNEHGIDGLAPSKRTSNRQWNSIPQEQKIFISESSVYRILKARGLISTPSHILLSAADEFKNKTEFVHQMWQTDFTYFKILGWGWYYLSTVLDDYSRYIVHWELCKGMKVQDVKRTIDSAMTKARIKSKQPPRLLSDNGSCYIATELKSYLKDTYDINQVHGRPMHPQTQGKIERYHRTMKNVVKLDNYYRPEELINALEKFVHTYNNERYHESIQNLTPADVYYGRSDLILNERKRIKKETIMNRKTEYERFKRKKMSNNKKII